MLQNAVYEHHWTATLLLATPLAFLPIRKNLFSKATQQTRCTP